MILYYQNKVICFTLKNSFSFEVKKIGKKDDLKIQTSKNGIVVKPIHFGIC